MPNVNDNRVLRASDPNRNVIGMPPPIIDDSDDDDFVPEHSHRDRNRPRGEPGSARRVPCTECVPKMGEDGPYSLCRDQAANNTVACYACSQKRRKCVKVPDYAINEAMRLQAAARQFEAGEPLDEDWSALVSAAIKALGRGEDNDELEPVTTRLATPRPQNQDEHSTESRTSDHELSFETRLQEIELRLEARQKENELHLEAQLQKNELSLQAQLKKKELLLEAQLKKNELLLEAQLKKNELRTKSLEKTQQNLRWAREDVQFVRHVLEESAETD
ncbi:hypothetical protein AK830_g3168 [Neonectria ditissima]|uniref:Uncharacterized protein n=1 Tax=Neonectria ditissima TaxID=78410 RepID=A0A0P7BPR7_9HYPO|nr:hypothetical protein AK830_g3168 [Neonectria ditissima]